MQQYKTSNRKKIKTKIYAKVNVSHLRAFGVRAERTIVMKDNTIKPPIKSIFNREPIMVKQDILRPEIQELFRKLIV